MATITVNGVEYEAPEEEFRSLLTFLIVDLGFTDMHYQCTAGRCGTCMLQVDGRWTKSCIMPVSMVVGKHVLTQGEIVRIQRERRERAAAEQANGQPPDPPATG